MKKNKRRKKHIKANEKCVTLPLLIDVSDKKSISVVKSDNSYNEMTLCTCNSCKKVDPLPKSNKCFSNIAVGRIMRRNFFDILKTYFQ